MMMKRDIEAEEKDRLGTYVDFLPLADVANESGEPQETDERQEFGEAQDAQCPTSLQDLEALAKVLHPQKLLDQTTT